MSIFRRLALLLALTLLACGGATQHQSHDTDDDVVLVAEGAELSSTLVEDGEGRWRTGAIAAGEWDFSRVGFRFDSEWSPLVEVRVSADEGKTWGEWQTAEITWKEDIAHNGHLDVNEAQATHVQLRFTTPNARDISFLAVNVFTLPPEGEGDLASDEGELNSGLGTVSQGLASDGMGLVTRGAWGARGTRCSAGHTPVRMTVHHTVTPNADSMTPAQRMRQIQSFHMDNRKWCDVGYHFLIGRDGRIYQGRAERLLGTHVGGNNTGNAGVSFVGTFTGVLPPQAMLDAGARALREIGRAYKISLNRERIRGHRQYGTTSCPGDRLYPHLDALVGLAQNGTPAPPPAPTCTSETFGDIGCSPFKEDIEWLAKEGIAAGCGNGNFCPDAHTTRGQMATFLTRALKLPAGADAFSDDTGHPHESSINAVAAAGITQGCGDGKFCPDVLLNRAQVAQLLARANNLPAGKEVFSDDNGLPAEPAINSIAAVGFTSGCAAGRYCPADSITRGQLARMLRRSVEYFRGNCGTPSASFTDIGCSKFQTEISWMKSAGITEGCGDGAFCPSRELKRGEVATFLARALMLPPGPDAFADDQGSVHEPGINAIAAAGISEGCGSGNYCPEASLTRAQLAALLSRALQLPPGPDAFTDDNGHPLEAEINAVAAAGLSHGCGVGLFCPADVIDRNHAAVFLYRAFAK